MTKKTVVLGASPNPERYSHKAVEYLREHEHPVVAIGLRNGTISNVEIQKGKPIIDNVHTVSLYLGSRNQPDYYQYILDLAPRRIIFNPGTYNAELIKLASENQIEIVEGCTLVMLGNKTF